MTGVGQSDGVLAALCFASSIMLHSRSQIAIDSIGPISKVWGSGAASFPNWNSEAGG